MSGVIATHYDSTSMFSEQCTYEDRHVRRLLGHTVCVYVSHTKPLFHSGPAGSRRHPGLLNNLLQNSERNSGKQKIPILLGTLPLPCPPMDLPPPFTIQNYWNFLYNYVDNSFFSLYIYYIVFCNI